MRRRYLRLYFSWRRWRLIGTDREFCYLQEQRLQQRKSLVTPPALGWQCPHQNPRLPRHLRMWPDVVSTDIIMLEWGHPGLGYPCKGRGPWTQTQERRPSHTRGRGARCAATSRTTAGGHQQPAEVRKDRSCTLQGGPGPANTLTLDF